MLNVYNYSNTREYLREYYEAKRKANPIFSHRYIGMKVGFSAGYFSRILTGDKLLSAAMVEKFIPFLELSDKEGEYFRVMTNYTQTKQLEERNAYYLQMLSLKNRRTISGEKNGYKLFAEWAHSVTFSLCRIESLTDDSDFTTLGKRISPKLSAKEIQSSLKLLLKMKLIEKSSEGVYTVVDSFLSSIGDESIHVQNYLNNSIKSAEHALDHVAREERELSTMMCTVSEEGYEKIRQKMVALRKEIQEIIALDSGVDRVCQANLHLFPLYKK